MSEAGGLCLSIPSSFNPPGLNDEGMERAMLEDDGIWSNKLHPRPIDA